MENNMMPYRPELDGLRAVAVLSVIMFHADVMPFYGGFVGVDIFFVLSGYFITSVILRDLSFNRFSYINFFERRMRRILPGLYFLILVCLPFAWFWLMSEDLYRFFQSLAGIIMFSSNILFWRVENYFDRPAELNPLLHTWSLAVEEQYYLIFPWIFALAWRRGRPWVWIFIGAGVGLSLWVSQWLLGQDAPAAFYLLPARMWELLLGAGAALFLYGNSKIPIRQEFAEIGGVVGIGLILYAVFFFNRNTPFPGVQALFPTIGATLVIVCVTPKTLVGRWLSVKYLVKIGLISYSAYLWHQPLLAFSKHLLPGETWVLWPCLGLTLMLAYFSWRYVETPFRDRVFIDRRNFIFYSMMLGGALFCMGWVGSLVVDDGGEKRAVIYSGDVGHVDFHQYVAEKYHRCTPESIAKKAPSWGEFLRCMQSKKDIDVDIALIGDSHAEHLFIGLAQELVRHNVVFYIRNSFPYLGNSDYQDVLTHAMKNRSIKVVFLAAQWKGRIKQLPNGMRFDHEIMKLASALMAAGKTVYLVGDVPSFPFQAENCKYAGKNGARHVCEVEASEVIAQIEDYNSALKQVTIDEPKIRWIELRQAFCNEISCSMERNNILMYRDSNHLNIEGSKYAGKFIVERFPELR